MVRDLAPIFYHGWQDYQAALAKAVAPLTDEQLLLRASPAVACVGEIAAHVIGVRARWFYLQFREGGDAFRAYCGWDKPEAPLRCASEIVQGLEATWIGIRGAIDRWTPEEWEQTWPGEDETEPAVITRPWVVWHVIEHDLYHGGQISITLSAHGLPALGL